MSCFCMMSTLTADCVTIYHVAFMIIMRLFQTCNYYALLTHKEINTNYSFLFYLENSAIFIINSVANGRSDTTFFHYS